MEPMPQNWSSK